MRTPSVIPITNETTYYKQMYEQANVAATNANTLTQWTLGSVAALITVVLGTQAFFNYQLGGGAIKSIKEETQRQIAEADRVNEEKLTSMRAELTMLSQQVKTVPQIINAKELLDKGQFDAALYAYLDVAEPRVTPTYIDGVVAHLLTANYLNGVTEFSEHTYKRLLKLSIILKDANHPAYHFFPSFVEGKKVYKINSRGEKETVFTIPAAAMTALVTVRPAQDQLPPH
jgi:hypothetical protein